MQRVPAVLGDEIDVNSAAACLRRIAYRRVRCLLDQFVFDVRLNLSVTLGCVHEHVVQQNDIVIGRTAMRRHVGLLDLLRAAHIRNIQMHGGDVGAHRLEIPRRWQCVDIRTCEDFWVGNIFHVYRGYASLDLQSLLCRSHLHVRVYRHRNARRHFHLLLQGAKSGTCEGHGVATRTHIDDGVSPFGIGGHHARSFDEGVTRGFDGCSGNNSAGSVFYLARDRALGPSNR